MEQSGTAQGAKSGRISCVSDNIRDAGFLFLKIGIQEVEFMASYNHSAIEKKWRENWALEPDQCQ